MKWSRKCEKGKKLDFEALLVSFLEEHNSEDELCALSECNLVWHKMHMHSWNAPELDWRKMQASVSITQKSTT